MNPFSKYASDNPRKDAAWARAWAAVFAVVTVAVLCLAFGGNA